jgi:hypothetical protein
LTVIDQKIQGRQRDDRGPSVRLPVLQIGGRMIYISAGFFCCGKNHHNYLNEKIV